MRTTVTLEPDVQAALREVAHRSGKPFKTTLNETIRLGLRMRGQQAPGAPPEWPSIDMGVPLVDLTKAMALADELDDRVLVARGTELSR